LLSKTILEALYATDIVGSLIVIVIFENDVSYKLVVVFLFPEKYNDSGISKLKYSPTLSALIIFNVKMVVVVLFSAIMLFSIL
jgi:hypothetical protein